MSVKVLIADDAEIMRRAIKFLLKDLDEITVVGEAADFPETVEEDERTSSGCGGDRFTHAR